MERPLTEPARPLRHQVVASFTISLGVFAATLNAATGLFDAALGDLLLAGALASCALPFLLDGSLARGFRPVLAAFAALFAVYAVSTLGNPEPRAAVHTGVILLVAIYLAAAYQYGEHLAASPGFAIVLVGALVAIASVINFAERTSIDPLAGNLWELFAVAACVIGGLRLRGGFGTVAGACLGIVMISLLRQGLVLVGLSIETFQAVFGFLLIAIAALNQYLGRAAGDD